jgi:thioesterase domain-containing protein
VTTARDLLSELNTRDVKLWLEDGRLKCSAPEGALDAELRAAMASQRAELLAFLRQAQALQRSTPAIVPIKAEGSRKALFAMPGHNGDVFCYVALARHLDPDQPLLGVQPPGLDGGEPLESVEALARYQVEQIRRAQPEGPYRLAGYCAGGTIAFEIAHQLQAAGQEVELLALLGSPFPLTFRLLPRLRLALADLPLQLSGQVALLRPFSWAERLRHAARVFTRLVRPPPPSGDPAVLAARQRVEAATLAALRSYQPRRYPRQLDLFVPSDASRPRCALPHQWRSVAAAMREHKSLVQGDPDSMLLEPRVKTLALSLQARLNELGR